MHFSNTRLAAPLGGPTRKRKSRVARIIKTGLMAPAMLLVGARVAMAPPGRGAPRKGEGAPRQMPLIPFPRAAHRIIEGPFFDETRTPGAASVQLGPFEVPARGYLRHINLQIEGSGGTLGAGVLHEDYPFRWIDTITLQDVNGRPIVQLGPNNGGYHLYLANLFGGYAFESDPAAAPDYVGTINCVYNLRIPVEITSRDGFGSIANQSAAAAFKVYITLANGTGTTGAFTTAPTTPPNIRIRGWLEGWSQPTPQDQFGNPQMTEPPAHGTTQYLSEQVYDVVSGQNTVRLTRMGNLIRNWIMVLRTAAGARSTANYPDPLRVSWDSRELLNESRQMRRANMFEIVGRTPPTGAFLYPFTDDAEGHVGNEDRTLYLPTVQPSRVELNGSFGAAGSLTIITNDIAPVGAAVRPEA